MKTEQWRQVNQLFHSALGRGADERAAFLDEACAGDEELRREVEELLNSYERAGVFMERPALEVEARSLVAGRAGALAGQTVAHYHVLRLLGSGGMGEVYLAQDTKLGRKVALKMLPEYLTGDEDRVRRFRQEARTASSLNHPNIVTIHEIGRAGPLHFIAEEFVDGVTLPEHMGDARLEPGEALDIAVQAAGALAAAHAKGVVHRDIKPQNIMLAAEGRLVGRQTFVKVLDFGIAKLTAPDESAAVTEATTRVPVNTSQGLLIGTAPYMSPEQARGERVDARTDIWSLGVVLYEMIAGARPFVGDTQQDVIASILKEDLPPLAEEVPESLRWIVKKALRKDREERYQTAKDMFSDLRDLLRQEDEKAGRALRPESEVKTGGGVTARQEPAVATDASAARPATSADGFAVKLRRNRRVSLILSASLLAAAAVAFGIYQLVQRLRPAPPFQKFTLTRLTNTGNVCCPAISPDAKYVAYVTNDGARQAVWVRHISTSSNVQVVPPTEADFYGLTFSPDGGYVYYNKEIKNDLRSTLYRVPVLGGTPSKVLDDEDSPVGISADGKRLAFVRLTTTGETYLMVADSDGSATRTVATVRTPLSIPARPVWSPDSQSLFCVLRDRSGGNQRAGIIKVRVADGAQEPFTPQRWASVDALSGLKDGGFVLVADDGIWHVSYPEGEARKITNDFNDYQDLSVSADSKTLVTVQHNRLTSIWVGAPDEKGGGLRQITTGVGDNREPVWTPDGKILYASNASGNLEVWVMNADGSGARQLTAGAGNNWYPTISPDGRYVVFNSYRSGPFHVWRVDYDGGNPRQLTRGSGEMFPYCSPDGRWVVYTSTAQVNRTLWKVPLEGGDPVQLTDKFSGVPAVSPDGRLIACVYFEQGMSAPAKLAVIPIEGGPPVKLFDIPATAVRVNEMPGVGIVRWSSDGRAVTYVDTRGGVSNIWAQPLDGGPPVQLTSFTSERIRSFNWSPDGRRLAVERGTSVNDVALIQDSR